MAPWAEKPDQRRTLVESEKVKDEMGEEEDFEQEQWCGAPECNQRYHFINILTLTKGDMLEISQ